jgi:hypothetical protein
MKGPQSSTKAFCIGCKQVCGGQLDLSYLLSSPLAWRVRHEVFAQGAPQQQQSRAYICIILVVDRSSLLLLPAALHISLYTASQMMPPRRAASSGAAGRSRAHSRPTSNYEYEGDASAGGTTIARRSHPGPKCASHLPATRRVLSAALPRGACDTACTL